MESSQRRKGDASYLDEKAKAGRTYLSVRGERYTVDRVRVTSESSELDSSLGVPQSNDRVETSSGEESSVRGERDTGGMKKKGRARSMTGRGETDREDVLGTATLRRIRKRRKGREDGKKRKVERTSSIQHPQVQHLPLQDPPPSSQTHKLPSRYPKSSHSCLPIQKRRVDRPPRSRASRSPERALEEDDESFVSRCPRSVKRRKDKKDRVNFKQRASQEL